MKKIYATPFTKAIAIANICDSLIPNSEDVYYNTGGDTDTYGFEEAVKAENALSFSWADEDFD